MALNVAVPLSGVSELFDGFGLISPISPLSFGFRENFQFRISSDYLPDETVSKEKEIKEDIEIPPKTSTPSILDNDDNNENDDTNTNNTNNNNNNNNDVVNDDIDNAVAHQQPIEQKIMYQGRDILNLHGNIYDPAWNLQYAHLPENNLQMFLKNRSQYHRLGASGHIQEFNLTDCAYCSFHYPTTMNYNENDGRPYAGGQSIGGGGGGGVSPLLNLQQQHPHQHHQQRHQLRQSPNDDEELKFTFNVNNQCIQINGNNQSSFQMYKHF